MKERRIDVVGELVLKGQTPKWPNSIAVSDRKKRCILIFDEDGNFVRKFGCYGEGPGKLLSSWSDIRE